MPVIDLSDTDAYFRTLSVRLHNAGKRGLLAAANRAKNLIVTRIIPARSPQPVDRGIFKAGWQAVPTVYGADLYNAETHAAFIEFGVRADKIKIGAAMLAALAEWAERKGMVAKGKGIGVAWAIAMRMKKRGIFNGGTGFNILGEVVDKYLPAIIKEEVAREIERELG